MKPLALAHASNLKPVPGKKAPAPSSEHFSLLAETFQALGDPSRVQIVWALSKSELCVGDLARAVGMSQPAVSFHLRKLRDMGLVRVRREGKSLFYRLDDEHIGRLLDEGLDHVGERMP